MPRSARFIVARTLAVTAAVPLWGQVLAQPTPGPSHFETWRRVLVAEDARVETPELQEELRGLIWSNDQSIAGLAVRAAGRTETPAKCSDILPLLVSPISGIRSAAAEAVSRCYVKQPNALLFGILKGLALTEAPLGERGRVAIAIGRLTYNSESDVRTAEQLLVALLKPALSSQSRESGSDPAPADLAVAVLTGLEVLERRHVAVAKPSAPVVELASEVVLDKATHVGDAAAREQWALARRLALQVLLTARSASAAVIDAALGDPDLQVRRLAALAVGREEPLRPEALGLALRDHSGLVRHAALSQLGRRGEAAVGAHCSALIDLTQDGDPHVALLALDLASNCRGHEHAIAIVSAEVDQRIGASPRGDVNRLRWHRPAHAVVSLAALAPQRAAAALSLLASDPTWQVRMYAARAAALAERWEILGRLATDPHDNVRETAIAELSAKRGREADSLALEALGRDDYQLLITAARALEGTPRRADARAALLAALDRTTRQQRETSRDARRALIERLGELGDRTDAARLELYLSDFDPAVASDVASLLAKWTGQARTAAPKPLPRLPIPTASQLAGLVHTRVVLHMRGLGEVELQLLAADAPLNAYRFARLAADGYYDGLTFHRVVPGFVIQGGSPGANEYVGDGPFTRDEIGVPNRRGTVGLSTRGRDTGDAQFYVNLVDNYRLDEDYTVFAEVVRGMTLVDRILEGDVIERAEVIRP